MVSYLAKGQSWLSFVLVMPQKISVTIKKKIGKGLTYLGHLVSLQREGFMQSAYFRLWVFLLYYKQALPY